MKIETSKLLFSPVSSSLQFLIFLFFLIIFAPPVFAAHSGNKVQVGAFDFKPLIFIDENIVRGINADLLNQIAEEKGWDIRYVMGSWQEGLSRIKEEKIDLITSVMYTEERAKYLDYSKQAILTVWGEVYLLPEANIENILDLDGKDVAIMEGDNSGDEFRKLSQKFGIQCNFKEVPTHNDVFTLIKEKKVDAGVAPNIFGIINSSRYGLMRSPIVFSPNPLYFASHKGTNKDLLSAIDDSLSRWKKDKDSFYQNTIDKWLGGSSSGFSATPQWVFYLFGGVMWIAASLYLWGRTLRIQVQARTKELSVSEELYRNLVEETPDLIVRVDAEGRILFVNHTALDIYGLPPEECLGRSAFDFIHHEDREATEASFNHWLQGYDNVFTYENRIVSIDGQRTHYMAWMILPEHNEVGSVIGFSSTARDMTNQKRISDEKTKLENQLQQAHKLESVGHLAAGIAHEFNNMLAIIFSNLGIIKSRQQSGVTFDENVEDAKQASERAKNLVAQILAFSRQENLMLEVVDLTTAVVDTVNFLRPMVPTTVEVMKVIPESPVTINADKAQFQQILINLCTNAVDAMEGKGLLQIVLTEEDVTEEMLSHLPNQSPGQYAKLSVSDTGEGMENEVLGQIFDPFFTTKEVGVGTGMGLSVVHGIVEQHGGFIQVDSTLGQGTMFNLYFPITNAKEITDEAAAEEPLPTGTERILLVDDEPAVADSCGAILEEILGYKVTVMTDSVKALELFKGKSHDFDLVITDQTMPKMSGVELAKELLSIRPDLSIILCSGYSAKVSEEAAKEIGIRAFCIKPLLMDQLALVVRNVLDMNE